MDKDIKSNGIEEVLLTECARISSYQLSNVRYLPVCTGVSVGNRIVLAPEQGLVLR